MTSKPTFNWTTLRRKATLLTLAAQVKKGCPRTIRWAVLAASLSILMPGAVRAQRLIAWPMVRPPATMPLPPRHFPPNAPVRPSDPALPPDVRTLPGVEVQEGARVLPIRHRGVEGSVRDQTARLVFEVRFFNDGNRLLEGDLYLPIPEDVVFDKLEMRVGDKVMHAELIDAESARATYQKIVNQVRDPALLELVSERMARVRVFPIMPNSEVRLTFSYTQLLHRSGNLTTLKLPMARYMSSGAQQRALALDFQTTRPLRLLYSPTHQIAVKRSGDRQASVTYDADGVQERDLVILYSLDEGTLSASLTAFKESGDKGYFLLSLDPRTDAKGPTTPKDIVFVVDRSGSMTDDGKIDQVKKALQYCLRRLGPQDRFGIVDFATEVRTFRGELSEASVDNVAKAMRYSVALEATGGTNIGEALDSAMKLIKRTSGRFPVIVFLTDGEPTVGERDPQALLRAFHDKNKSLQARFFCFGAGQDVNTLFLDKLAEGERGSRDYVLPGEDIEEKVSRLSDRISKPALTDLAIRWEGVEVSEIVPRTVSDLYYGDALILLGRYSKGGSGKATISGNAGGRIVRLEVPLSLPDRTEQNAFLPRLWAHRKVAQLLDDIRLSGGANPEIVGEIGALARRYGIVTPYTSFFIADDADMKRAMEQASRGLQAMATDSAGASMGAGGSFGALRSAAGAMSFSRNVQFMISGAASSLESSQNFGAPDAPEPSRKPDVRIHSIGNKTFYLRDGCWTDSVYEMDKAGYRVETVPAFGKKFFELLKRHQKLASYLTQGGDYLVVLDGKAYRITTK